MWRAATMALAGILARCVPWRQKASGSWSKGLAVTAPALDLQLAPAGQGDVHALAGLGLVARLLHHGPEGLVVVGHRRAPAQQRQHVEARAAAAGQRAVVDGHHHVAQLQLVGRALVHPGHAPLRVHAGDLGEQAQLVLGHAPADALHRPQHEGLDLGGGMAQRVGGPGHMQRGGAEAQLLREADLVLLALEAAVPLRRRRQGQRAGQQQQPRRGAAAPPRLGRCCGTGGRTGAHRGCRATRAAR